MYVGKGTCIKKYANNQKKNLFHTYIKRERNCLFCLVDFQSVAVATRIETVNWFRTHLDKASWKNVFPVDIRGQFITGNEDVNIVYFCE